MKVFFLGFPKEGYPTYFKDSLPENLDVETMAYDGWPPFNPTSRYLLREFDPDLIILKSNLGTGLPASIEALKAIKSDSFLAVVSVVMIGFDDLSERRRFRKPLNEEVLQLGAAAVLALAPAPETSSVLGYTRV